MSATCVSSDNVDIDHEEPKGPDTLEHVDIVVCTASDTSWCTRCWVWSVLMGRVVEGYGKPNNR